MRTRTQSRLKVNVINIKFSHADYKLRSMLISKGYWNLAFARNTNSVPHRIDQLYWHSQSTNGVHNACRVSIFKRLAKELLCPLFVFLIFVYECVRVHPILKSSAGARLSPPRLSSPTPGCNFGQINETHERLSRREYRRGYCGMRSECKCRGCDKRPAALSSLRLCGFLPAILWKIQILAASKIRLLSSFRALFVIHCYPLLPRSRHFAGPSTRESKVFKFEMCLKWNYQYYRGVYLRDQENARCSHCSTHIQKTILTDVYNILCHPEDEISSGWSLDIFWTCVG